jgi:hypothetical protein
VDVALGGIGSPEKKDKRSTVDSSHRCRLSVSHRARSKRCGAAALG